MNATIPRSLKNSLVRVWLKDVEIEIPVTTDSELVAFDQRESTQDDTHANQGWEYQPDSLISDQFIIISWKGIPYRITVTWITRPIRHLLWSAARDDYEDIIVKVQELLTLELLADQQPRIGTCIRCCNDSPFLTLKYRTDSAMEEHWLKLTSDDILSKITNLRFLEWLKDKSDNVPPLISF